MKRLLFFVLAARSIYAEPPTREITIHLYNLSGVSEAVLDGAIREASRIFRTAGADLVWERGNPDAEEAHASDRSGKPVTAGRRRRYLVVRIGKGLTFGVPAAALGESLPYAKSGISTTIFQERVESLCEREGLDLSALLGYVMAHELGHVILSLDVHTARGIMRARLGAVEYRLAGWGQLRFDPEQEAKIRDYAVRSTSPRLDEVFLRTYVAMP